MRSAICCAAGSDFDVLQDAVDDREVNCDCEDDGLDGKHDGGAKDRPLQDRFEVKIGAFQVRILHDEGFSVKGFAPRAKARTLSAFFSGSSLRKRFARFASRTGWYVSGRKMATSAHEQAPQMPITPKIQRQPFE